MALNKFITKKAFTYYFASAIFMVPFCNLCAQNSISLTNNTQTPEDKIALSQYELENLSDNAILQKSNFSKKKAEYIAGANSGDAMAMYLYALFLSNGASADPDKARPWLRKSAIAGNKYATYRLGFEILGNATDLKTANSGIILYEKAANLGHINSLIELGRIYNKGTDLPIPRNITKSLNYYNLAIAKGSNQAKIDLAYIYIEGQGIAKDLNKAKALLLNVAKSDDELGELARASLLEEFSIDCEKSPNLCK
jgi:TPR repeat protein